MRAKCGVIDEKCITVASVTTQEWLDPAPLIRHEWAVIFAKKITDKI
jgi:hypothetical protein